MIPNSDPDYKGLLGDLTSESPKDKPWTTHKIEADILQDTLANTFKVLKNYDPEIWGMRMLKCAQALHFGVTNSETGKTYKLQSAEFCRVSICPICTWRRSMKWRAKLIQGFNRLVQAYPDHEYLFLTLTIRNCPTGELRAKIEEMVKGWDSLRHRKEFPAIGYVRSLEVTRNPETGECHPHFHCLLMVPKSYFTGKYYLSQVKWTHLWQKSMGLDYVPVVNVKKIRQKAKRTEQLDLLEGQGKLQADLDNGLLVAILETAKYSVKPGDLISDPDWTLEVADQMFRLQRTVTGGLIRKFINDKDDNDDLVHLTEEEEETIDESDYQVIFNWKQSVKKYLPRRSVQELTN